MEGGGEGRRRRGREREEGKGYGWDEEGGRVKGEEVGWWGARQVTSGKP